MTLAYQYPTEQHESLLKLAKDIDMSADVQWDFRLYSRDIRVGQTEVCTFFCILLAKIGTIFYK